ncbi:MAG: 23S rRNA (adenine(2030)-N(6))-methyltransferase RlmJ [Aestuariibacter sp.]
MLSYQHHYHVGNHGDVLKHWVLYEVFCYLQKKPKPFDYIDTHAGAGLYQLNDGKTLKLKEYESGIARLLNNPPNSMSAFCELMASYTKQGLYPGSSYLANSLLRRGDRSWLYELHPATFKELEQHCPKRRYCFPRNEDGFTGLLGLLPNQAKRAVVLIDPSYELKEDYQKVVSIAEKSLQKMPNTVVLIWYPVVNRQHIEELLKAIRHSTLNNVLNIELRTTSDGDAKGMTGSGMIVINPPWTLKSIAQEVLPALSDVLAADEGAGYDVQQLVEE